MQDSSDVLFAHVFYFALDNEPKNYRLAFTQETTRMKQISGAQQGSLDVVCFLSKDGPIKVHAPRSVSTGPVQTLPTHTILYPLSNRSDLVETGFFKVHLNQAVTQGLSDTEWHALAHDFADWAPSPNLFQQGDEVNFVPQKMQHEKKFFTFPEYTSKEGKVVAHSKEDPLTVKVRLDGGTDTDAEDINVLVSVLTLQNASAESSVARTERMLALANTLETLDANASVVNAATIIGCIEFLRGDRLELKY